MSWIDAYRVSHAAQLPDVEVPRLYHGLTLAGIQQLSVKDMAEEYLEQFWEFADKGLAPGLFGRSGTYKSWAASLIIESIHHRAMVPSLYVQAGPEFNRLERRRFDPATESRLTDISTRAFVVLDDITDLKGGTVAMDMLDGVVKQRDANGLLTLYTGNSDLKPTPTEALVPQFGAAMTRRVLRTTKGLLLALR